MEAYYRHYLKVNEQGEITEGWSSGPHPERNTEGAVLLRETYSYQFRLEEGGEENPPLFDEEGRPVYLWDGEKAIRKGE